MENISLASAVYLDPRLPLHHEETSPELLGKLVKDVEVTSEFCCNVM